MSVADEEYDKLSKEEREVRDHADRAREVEEQSGVLKSVRIDLISYLLEYQHCPILGDKN